MEKVSLFYCYELQCMRIETHDTVEKIHNFTKIGPVVIQQSSHEIKSRILFSHIQRHHSIVSDIHRTHAYCLHFVGNIRQDCGLAIFLCVDSFEWEWQQFSVCDPEQWELCMIIALPKWQLSIKRSCVYGQTAMTNYYTVSQFSNQCHSFFVLA